MIACVGGGSNAIGTFYAFLDDPVELIGVEAGGEGIESGRHGASLVAGSTGVLHGAISAVLADEHGQILEAHSVSAGLDYPGVGPEHAYLRDTGRARYLAVTDAEALRAFRELARLEGIIPALESAHAIAWLLSDDAPARRLRHPLPLRPRRQGHGRGRPRSWPSSMADQTSDHLRDRCRASRGGVRTASPIAFAAARAEGRAALMPYLMAGFPDAEGGVAVARAYADAGADLIELGIPFSDPLADGPVIHAAATAALEAGADLEIRARGLPRPSPIASPWSRCVYSNMILAGGGAERVRRAARRRGRRGRDRPRPPARGGGCRFAIALAAGAWRWCRCSRRRPRRSAGARSARAPRASSTSSRRSG